MAQRWVQLVAFGLCVTPWAGAFASQPLSEISAFNDALRRATQSMQIDVLIDLWDDQGVTLLPETAPVIGKPAITRFLKEVTAQLGSARMQRFELACFDILVSGSWASEWCQEHQIVDLGNDKPPFEGRGNMLLVLHRRKDGQWRLIREMWNQAARE